MVLQSETEAAVWGWADPGQPVRVRGTWSDDHESITAAGGDGRWRTTVPTPAPGGPYRLLVEAGTGDDATQMVLDDVLIGEVWIASGQSNMWWPVSWCADAEAEIAAADHPRLRLFTVPQAVAMEPRDDLDGGSWTPCSPESVAGFSASAYYFGRDLHRELGVPVGLVHTSWGGTPVEAWTSRGTIERAGDFAEALARIDEALGAPEGHPTVEELQASWWVTLEERDPGFAGGWMSGPLEEGAWTEATVPGFFRDIGLGEFDGCVWYRRSVTLDPAWAGRGLVLELGPVDDMDLTFFNGRLVGETRQHGRWQEARHYRVPGEHVRAGENEIAVCAVDSGGAGSVGVAGESAPAMRLYPEGDGDGHGEAVALKGRWRARAGASMAVMGAFPRSTWFNQHVPTALHNAMIAPIVPFAARGAVWYQGESNRSRSVQYRRLFPALIADWRRVWGRELSFYYVQIAPFAYGGDRGEAAELREAQELALALPRTGMAVTMDVGNPDDIHPKNKQAVGRRLALWALARDYGRDVVCSGPLYRAMVVAGSEARLSFAWAAGGLVAEGAPTCFTVAGEDRVFHPAQARIEGETVVVWSDAVPRPAAVRHAWGAADEPNLQNAAGLPAPSFRTDRWPAVGR